MIGPGIILAAPAAVIIVFIFRYIYTAQQLKRIKRHLRARGNMASSLLEANFPENIQLQIPELQRLISKHTGIPVENIALDDDVWEDLGLRYQAPDAMGALVVEMEQTFNIDISTSFCGRSLTLRQLILILSHQSHDQTPM